MNCSLALSQRYDHLTIGCVTLVAIAETSVLVPSLSSGQVSAAHLQMATHRFHLQVPGLQMSCSDLSRVTVYLDSSPGFARQVTYQILLTQIANLFGPPLLWLMWEWLRGRFCPKQVYNLCDFYFEYEWSCWVFANMFCFYVKKKSHLTLLWNCYGIFARLYSCKNCSKVTIGSS